jgi:hypothetical protein
MRPELALALVLAACGTPASAPSACPTGTHADATHASAIEARLGSIAAGRALLDVTRAEVPAICFGDAASTSVITRARVVLLADGLEEGEAAARLGHLLVHVRDGLPIDQLHPPCDAAVEHAMALEARAYVEELALQDGLAAHPTTLAFEFADAVRDAAPDAREGIVRTYLHAHPDGAPGIDGLESAYRELCR